MLLYAFHSIFLSRSLNLLSLSFYLFCSLADSLLLFLCYLVDLEFSISKNSVSFDCSLIELNDLRLIYTICSKLNNIESSDQTVQHTSVVCDVTENLFIFSFLMESNFLFVARILLLLLTIIAEC